MIAMIFSLPGVKAQTKDTIDILTFNRRTGDAKSEIQLIDTTKSNGGQTDTAKMYVPTRFVIEIGGSVERSAVIGMGVQIGGEIKGCEYHLPRMLFLATWSYPVTSFGFSYEVFPRRWVGFGVEYVYYYTYIGASQFFSFGNGPNTIVGDSWKTKRSAFYPMIDIRIPIHNCNLGVKADFLWGCWNFESFRYTEWKRYTDIKVYLNIVIPSGRKKK